MNWKKWLGYGIYKKLWSLIGQRPWTFITRDIWHEVEYLCIMVCLFSGFFTGYYWARYDICLWWLAVLWGVSTLWFILGHIFWGRKYIPNQPGI